MPIIYTPSSIWKNFLVDAEPSFISAGRKEQDGIIFENGYIEGRYVDGVRIKIFVSSARKEKNKMPAVLVFNDFSINDDKNLLVELANQGYFAVMVNIAGKTDASDNYTVYPEKISFANLEESNYKATEINEDITKICYYEWCGVAQYVVSYIKSLSFVTKIGALGINDGATTLWHLLATTEDISCAVFVNNTGWKVYEGKSKFLSGVEEGYSDGKIAYSAGIEPQSYATHIKCPTLILSCTNSKDYDCDRAYDTFARIDEKLYKAISYSVNRTYSIQKSTFNDGFIFFEKFLQSKRTALPKPIELKNSEGENLVITAKVDNRNVKSVSLYVAEGVVEPRERCWKKYSEITSIEDKYVFDYLPNIQNGFVCWFVKAEYKTGYEVSSRIFAKQIVNKAKKSAKASNIVYTSREPFFDSQFASANEDEIKSVIDVMGNAEVEVKSGPLKMLGITGKGGIYSFNVCNEKISKDANSVLMFDVNLKNSGTIVVKLISDCFNNRVEYSAFANVVGENIWQNVKFSINNFKTAEGLPLKSYEKIQVIEFNSSEEFLINNVLWI